MKIIPDRNCGRLETAKEKIREFEAVAIETIQIKTE